ncbi:MAG: restriction endonuclease subunit S [Desulfitobacteriaceae bacterium]
MVVNSVKKLSRNDSKPFIVEPIDVPKDELRWSTVTLSEVQDKDNRLEASVFDIEGKHAREVLNKGKYPLTKICSNEGGLATAFHRLRFKRIWVEKSDYPIFQPSQIVEIYPKPNSYISKLTNTDIDALRVKKGQILLTCSGTIGNCTIVGRTLDNKIFSHDLIRIECIDEIDTGFIYAFLRTKIGQTLVNTNSYGAVISHIEPEHLKDVPIPNPPSIIKRQIHDLIMESFNLRDESNELIDKATQLMVEELNLPLIEELKQDVFDKNTPFANYVVKLSQLDNRLDGSYHVPITQVILSHFNEYSAEVTTIGDERISENVILPGRFKRVYVDEGQGRVFFGGKQLLELHPSSKKYLSLVHHGERIKKQLQVTENTILITRSGTIGKVTIVPKHWEGWIPNEHIIRIIPTNAEMAGYLYIFLLSDYGRELAKRYTYGAVVDEIDEIHVSQIGVPLLKNRELQKEIGCLALAAIEKRHRAYKLEQRAIKIINDDIIHSLGI